MTEKLQRLELTWPGKEDRFNPEPRILLEDKEKSYSKPVISSPLREKERSSAISSPLRREDKGEGEQPSFLPLSSKECSSVISSPLRGEDKGEGEQPNLLSLAKKMRHNPTEAENKMWQILRNNQLGYKIRRQHQIGQYIVDFICLEKKLIIECDGGQHNETVDKERTLFLENEGFRVIRFWNNEILNNIEGCWEIIQKSLNDCTPHPTPLPQGARNSIVLETSPLREEGDTLVSGEGDKLNLLKTKRIQPTFDNMLIHGDNLLALKALEQDYTGKIKCIYIDPPYNTGNAFEHYDDGLEHSIWLSLMRDRLEILRRLLAENGSIWISLDDNEQAYCKVLCDEIFGRQNFVCNVIWQKKYAPANDAKWLSDNHDFIIVYAKNKMTWRPNLLPRTEEQNKYYKYDDNDGRGRWRSDNVLVKTFSQSGVFAITNPNTGKEYYPPKGSCYRFNEETAIRLLKENRFYFGKDGKGAPQLKRYLSEVKQGMTPLTIWPYEEVGHNQDAKLEVKQFNPTDIFATPKPERLIQRILTLASNPGDLVLDSFLGSGTTAAVAQKMGRRWIGVEMGDHVYTHCIPRLKKVIDGEDQGGITKTVNWQGGGGFKFYELASSLIVTDKYGQQIISKEYNADMLAEAMCKILGYHYKPDKEIYWKQGFSSEKNFIYTTTMSLQESSLDRLAEEIGDNNLLICCSAFVGNSRIYPNISVKKIPAAILKKCEWGREGYPLNLRNYHPTDEEFEFEEEEE